MNNQQLSVFCDSSRHEIEKPFSLGPWSYATNGHLVVRVPRADDVPEWDAINERAQALFDRVDMAAAEAALIEIPELPKVETTLCTTCAGQGRVKECPECDGEGEVELESSHHRYFNTCKTCNGDGLIGAADNVDDKKICTACHGTGKKTPTVRVPLGATGFSLRYLSMLKAIPGMRIAPLHITDAAYFRFDGGEGLLMPMSV